MYKKINLGISYLLTVFISMGSTLAASPITNFKDFVTTKLTWLDWAVYIGLLITLTILLSETLLKNAPKSKFFSFVLSFPAITGFVFVLANQEIFPAYFIFFAAEIFVIGLLILAWYLSYTFFKDSDGGFKIIPWITLATCIFLLGIWHGQLIQTAGTGTSATIGSESLLYKIAKVWEIKMADSSYISGFIIVSILATFLVGENRASRATRSAPGSLWSKLKQRNQAAAQRNQATNAVNSSSANTVNIYRSMVGP